ncbi:hypothetical protein B0H13DRAFT_1866531 [Mycena leptocephala]|nr:hypothetical protein B0H13DRAFT_1866531 [Mycena leptocephala]
MEVRKECITSEPSTQLSLVVKRDPFPRRKARSRLANTRRYDRAHTRHRGIEWEAERIGKQKIQSCPIQSKREAKPNAHAWSREPLGADKTNTPAAKSKPTRVRVSTELLRDATRTHPATCTKSDVAVQTPRIPPTKNLCCSSRTRTPSRIRRINTGALCTLHCTPHPHRQPQQIHIHATPRSSPHQHPLRPHRATRQAASQQHSCQTQYTTNKTLNNSHIQPHDPPHTQPQVLLRAQPADREEDDVGGGGGAQTLGGRGSDVWTKKNGLV